MISKTDVAPVNEYKKATGRVLSVYLDVDQSNASNLNRSFEAAFQAKVNVFARTFEQEYEHCDFETCVAEVRSALERYEPRGRGLVIFARSAGSMWMRELNVPVTTGIFWGVAPHVQQFLEALDEFEMYGVVLSDRCHSRILTAKLGVLEKFADIHALRTVGHVKTTGTDHLYSQSHLQRRADEHALCHLKHVVDLLEHLSKIHPFDRLVLAGATDATSELFRLLPKIMRNKVIASATLPVKAAESRILEEVFLLGRKAERACEVQKVETLITASAKGHQAVIALENTLAALNERRVHELVYSQWFPMRVGVCETCDAVFPDDTMHCSFCNHPVKPSDDFIETAITIALAQGASIEQVRGEAAEKLRLAGGIGAFLRY